MHRYIFDANTNTKWAATSVQDEKKIEFQVWVQVGGEWCAIIEYKHMDT